MIVILDKALKHPVVITGVTRFARSKGIPMADAILRLGSLALAKILKAMPEEVREEVGKAAKSKVEEMDAAELERTSTVEDIKDAEKIGKQADGVKDVKTQNSRGGCVVM